MKKLLRTTRILLSKYNKLAALIACSAVLSSHGAMAQNAIDDNDFAPLDITVASDDSTENLSIVTGSSTGTYFRFGKDIKRTLTSNNIAVDVLNSKGSIDNINQIGDKKEATFGIVQSDVLGFLKRSTRSESKKIADGLRMVFPFYDEEVHIIAKKDIARFEDLNGKRVIVGQKGSGSWLTSVNMFNITGIRPAKMLRISPEKGLVDILNGKADAMIFVAGKPVKLFRNLDSLSEVDKYAHLLDGVHLLPVTNEDILKEYATSVITSQDYSFVQQPITTAAVTAVLVSHESQDTPRPPALCNRIKAFSQALNENIDDLHESGHAKWREVDLTAEIGLWEKDPCVATSSLSSTLEEEMLDTLNINW